MYVSNRTFIKPYQWIAKVLGLQVKEICRRLYGEKHPDTVLSSYGLAAILAGMGCFEEAEIFYWEVLQNLTEIFGEEHPETLRSMSRLAATFYSLGLL
ncbi:hypothetical protein FPQ18DRAFT_262642 [Pyronema domesticum]|nr:hypothetical protein FPQ18DRAFT_262642 [Pyronema domesticum]